MHKKILKDATDEQIRNFVTDFISTLKAKDEELYNEAEWDLYKEVYGCHFNQWKLDCALENLNNEDGTKGAHWTVDQTEQVAIQNGISFDKFNKYDWNYVMNMIYSDYYGAIGNSIDSYFKIAKKFLMRKDSPEGKALKYYIAMK